MGALDHVAHGCPFEAALATGGEHRLEDPLARLAMAAEAGEGDDLRAVVWTRKHKPFVQV